MTECTSAELRAGLSRFQSDVNAHPQMVKILNKWEPDILIESSDSGDCYTIAVRNSKITEISQRRSRGEHVISVRSTLNVLIDVFCGSLSPARAHDDGRLQIFASERDQIKLDTISLILWGL